MPLAMCFLLIISISGSVKNAAGILMEITWNLWAALGHTAFYTVINLLTQEHGKHCIHGANRAQRNKMCILVHVLLLDSSC